MKGFVSGVAIPRIVLKDFRKFQIQLPPLPLQQQFAKFIEPMLRLCVSLTERNENLRTTRDLLLPKLVSGEIRVETFEKEALAQTV
jgi:type I restriction enzyme S subunit